MRYDSWTTAVKYGKFSTSDCLAILGSGIAAEVPPSVFAGHEDVTGDSMWITIKSRLWSASQQPLQFKRLPSCRPESSLAEVACFPKLLGKSFDVLLRRHNEDFRMHFRLSPSRLPQTVRFVSVLLQVLWLLCFSTFRIKICAIRWLKFQH